jgi:hypothetical protein
MSHQLIETWKRFSISGAPFILEEDYRFLSDKVKVFSHESYIKSDVFCNKEDKSLHAGLCPIPYAGSLDNAKIFLLQLNPGFSPGNYFPEYSVSDFREAQIRSLSQSNADDPFPFIYIDPRFWSLPRYEKKKTANTRKLPPFCLRR